MIQEIRLLVGDRPRFRSRGDDESDMMRYFPMRAIYQASYAMIPVKHDDGAPFRYDFVKNRSGSLEYTKMKFDSYFSNLGFDYYFKNGADGVRFYLPTGRDLKLFKILTYEADPRLSE